MWEEIMDKIIVYAHRGASAYAPENTMAAFKKALALGADGIELDVQLTKDNKLVVIHDYELQRVSNSKGMVKDKTLMELKELDFGSRFSKEYKDERIPTLEEVLELIEGWNGILNVEIKSAPNLSNEGVEEKVIEVLRKYDQISKTIISSFNHLTLIKIKEIAADAKTAILYEEQLEEPWTYAKYLGTAAIHPSGYVITPEIVRSCHKENVKVNVWTLNKAKEISLAIEAGVDGIITNYPDIALKLVKNQ
jgi:glycerophosphoryl diester phosphodiesterase